MKRPLEVFFAALILGEIFALKEQNIYLLLLFVLFVNIIIKLIGKHIKRKIRGFPLDL